MPQQLLSFACRNCGKDIKVKIPTKSGIYNIECPHCHNTAKVKLPGLDTLGTPAPMPSPAPVPPAPAPMPAPGPAPVPTPAGENTKTNPINIQNRQGRGKLVRIGKFLNDTYALEAGKTVTIGRYDEDKPSDIGIKGDSCMSRRSISLSVRYDDLQGYTYRLKVLSATNPVLLNKQPLAINSDTYLNFGDIITLGHTQLRLEQSK